MTFGVQLNTRRGFPGRVVANCNNAAWWCQRQVTIVAQSVL